MALPGIGQDRAQAIIEHRRQHGPFRGTVELLQVEGIGDATYDKIKEQHKKITEETGVTIDIEQDGRVMITSNDAEGMKQAVQIVKDLTREVEAGEEFEGKVVRLEDFGAFVELLPGKDGLVHVSEISWERTNKPSDVLSMGQKVKVKVKEIDSMGRVSLSMKLLTPKPEGYVDPAPRPSFDRGSRGPSRGGFVKRDR